MNRQQNLSIFRAPIFFQTHLVNGLILHWDRDQGLKSASLLHIQDAVILVKWPPEQKSASLLHIQDAQDQTTAP